MLRNQEIYLYGIYFLVCFCRNRKEKDERKLLHFICFMNKLYIRNVKYNQNKCANYLLECNIFNMIWIMAMPFDNKNYRKEDFI
ncbi:hypothetical protein bsdtb5_19240 [Anaeromicropila herbilytica]|uniref:Uncharacterized protein n=1 Tax=Anaeromicropila herbilytica TaxID=2785025 RepID=A0A7R7EKW0_9FIRM|nr:hypothetical protein bsdtb5_19240 [Anaeromicropila herbilytica]